MELFRAGALVGFGLQSGAPDEHDRHFQLPHAPLCIAQSTSEKYL